MDRPSTAIAAILFGLRSLVNVVILVDIVRLLSVPSSGVVKLAVVFGALIAIPVLVPIVLATLLAAVRMARRSPNWRPLAMNVIAACLVCDLYFVAPAFSWWIAAVVISADITVFALLWATGKSEQRADAGAPSGSVPQAS